MDYNKEDKLSVDSRASDPSDLSYLAKYRKTSGSIKEDINKNDEYNASQKSDKERHERSLSKRSKSIHSHKHQQFQRKNMDFLIYVFENAISLLRANNESKLAELRYKNQDSKIFFEDRLIIPDVNGSVLIIQNESLSKKADVARQFFQLLKDNNLEDKKDKGQNALILVPNGLVSMVIGTKGKQIINLARNTRTNIAVNQPVFKMLHRTISISGYPPHIADALKQIYQIMEDRYYEVKVPEVESIPIDLFENASSLSIIMPIDSIDVIGKTDSSQFIMNLRDKFGVSLSVNREKRHEYIEHNECLIVSYNHIIIYRICKESLTIYSLQLQRYCINYLNT